MSQDVNKEVQNDTKYITMMLYTDGSAGSGNPPYIGMGYHGYYFVNNTEEHRKSADVPKKGYPSRHGYVGPDNEVEMAKYNKDHIKVVPVGYLDGYVSTTKIRGFSINAETLAVRNGLDVVLEYFKSPVNGILTDIYIFSDSAYALLVYERAYKHLEEHKDWLTNQQAMKVQLDTLYKTPSTREYVEEAFYYFNKVKQEFPNLKIHFKKVAGHTGNIGNEAADKLAVTGRKRSEVNKDEHNFGWSVNRYWKPTIDRHPFLRYKELFFIHNIDYQSVNSSAGYFTVMNYGSIEPGKKSGEPIYGIIHLDEPPVILQELVKAYEHTNTNRPILVYAVDTNKLFAPELQKHLVNFGTKAFTFNKFDHMLLLDTDSLVYPIYPPGLAKKAYDETQNLASILEQAKADIEANDPGTSFKFIIDITDKIYKKDDKGKQVCILPNATNSIPLEVTLDKEKIKLHLYMDKDILSRNMLKSMEKDDVNVYVLFIRQGRLYYNYYTIIINKTLKSYGIWTNLYASKVFLDDKKHQDAFEVKPKSKGKK